MPHRTEKLKAALADLHQEIGQIETLDAETRGLLNDALDDIQTALDPQNETTLEKEGVSNQLEGVLRRFGDEHPSLSNMLRSVIDALGQLGI